MDENVKTEATEKKSLNFIEQKIERDLAEGKNGGRLQTRFPPEPNGYLHIGHAKAIALNFGLAKKYGGICNLRFDDTNPQKEDTEYMDSIENDIRWLGFKWDNIYYASDYFEQLWDFAVALIKQGRAYVDEQSAEQIAATATDAVQAELTRQTDDVLSGVRASLDGAAQALAGIWATFTAPDGTVQGSAFSLPGSNDQPTYSGLAS